VAIVRRDNDWRIVDDANRSTGWSEASFLAAAARLASKA
jgi:SH3-like domain-containing protein